MASAALELPTFKGRPGWEFTDISALNLAAYEPVAGARTAQPARALCSRLPAAEPTEAGVIVTSIDQAAREHGELLRRHLGSLIPEGDDVFVALNDAGYRDRVASSTCRSGVVLEHADPAQTTVQPGPGRCSTSGR